MPPASVYLTFTIFAEYISNQWS